ncbi:hypothetical protein [Yoonia sp.]|uniref:hypothetical protein n=1 Tax=Yoonia sp. TaxID=2212373 RepID=UPI0023B7048D
MRVAFFFPLAALIAFAAYLGLRSGQMPGETEIINRYAVIYLQTAPEGAAPTDCAATTHPDPAVRMVINCAHPNGVTTTFYAGPRGASLPQPTGPDL